MLSKINSCAIQGIDAYIVEVETHMEGTKVTISHASLSLTYTANFMLAAAMNPCPCGYYSDPAHNCFYTPS